MSKPETPCLGSCGDFPYGEHSPWCPNAPKAEAPPAPKPEVAKYSPLENRLTLDGVDVVFPPAPPANVSGRTMTLQTQTPGGANVSGPPIDWDDALKFARIFKQQEKGEPGGQANACRAYLALKAQNAALSERLNGLREFVQNIADDNCVEGCGCGFVAKQVLAEDDAIRATREGKK